MRLVTITDYAKLTGYSRQKVWNDINSGKIERVYVCNTSLLQISNAQDCESLEYSSKDSYLTIEEAARKINMSESYVRKNAEFSNFKATKLGKKWFLPSEQFNNWKSKNK